MLRDFAVREVSFAENVPGDPVPRGVFHCRRRATTVMFITGKTGVGKTDLVTTHLGLSADKVIRVDHIVSRVALGSFAHGPLQQAIKEHYSPADLSGIYAVILE